MYKFNEVRKAKIKSPVLIEGLPGIGNVGKIAVDFIIDNIKAEKIYEISSYNFPHAVFVNEKNLVELPTIEIFHKRLKNQDYLLLAGDIQPIDEASCYEFCDILLDLFEKYNGREIITIGGIGMQQVPKNPKVYSTANNKKIIQKYMSKNMTNQIYGVVGPIVGISGLLVGLSGTRKIPSIALLAETYGHPAYLGIKGAREVLKILNDKLNLNLNLEKLDDEIDNIEKEITTKTKQFEFLQKAKRPKTGGVDYIG